MSRKRTTRKPPSYRLHKSSGQGVVSLPRGDGTYRDYLLGTYGTPESYAEYRRVLAEWESLGRSMPTDEATKADLTVNELILRMWPRIEEHYRHPDGTPTSEVADFRLSLRPLKELYGHTIAAEFGPLALKTVRQKMMETPPEDPKKKRKGRKAVGGLVRRLINARINRIKRLFKWAVSDELVPSSVYHGLQAVDGLKRGRSKAREHTPVLPVSDDVIDQTLPHLTPHVRGMVQVQRLTGMRPGEVCKLRRADIDMSGVIWLYRPAQHKTAWRDKDRLIGIGPKAQEILKTYFTPNLDDYLFSPKHMTEQRYTEIRAKRKTKVQPSQLNRKGPTPKRKLGERYKVSSYDAAIGRGANKAGVPLWSANQLRHSYGTEIRKRFGLEAAQVGLGHARADVTQVYAESNQELVTDIAAKVG